MRRDIAKSTSHNPCISSGNEKLLVEQHLDGSFHSLECADSLHPSKSVWRNGLVGGEVIADTTDANRPCIFMVGLCVFAEILVKARNIY